MVDLPELVPPPAHVELLPLGATLPSRFPDFLGIGAQKAGTTWLFENLRRHPDIWLPPVKELQYFNDLYIPHHRKWIGLHRRNHGIRILNRHIDQVPQDQRNYPLIARMADYIASPISDDWYGSMFRLAGDTQSCGEITPEYSLLPREGIEHILRLSPEVKILFMLRDPIERNWSHIRMIARNEVAPDLRKIANYPDVELRSAYPELIARWAALVPEKQFLVLFADDMLTRPAEVLAETCGFLGIDFDPDLFPNLYKRVHVGAEVAIPDDLYATLKQRLRPIYEQLRMLYPDIGQRWLDRHY